MSMRRKWIGNGWDCEVTKMLPSICNKPRTKEDRRTDWPTSLLEETRRRNEEEAEISILRGKYFFPRLSTPDDRGWKTPKDSFSSTTRQGRNMGRGGGKGGKPRGRRGMRRRRSRRRRRMGDQREFWKRKRKYSKGGEGSDDINQSWLENADNATKESLEHNQMPKLWRSRIWINQD